MVYNGCTHEHYLYNVMVFASSRVIIACEMNALGEMNDSIVTEWGLIYEKSEQCFEKYGGRVVVDSAFSHGEFHFLLMSALDYLGAAEGAEDVTKMRQATSAQ